MRLLIAGAAVAVAVGLSGCATQIMQSYVGKTVQDAAVRYGPPTNVFDMPDGRRAFQWSVSSTYVAPRTTTTNLSLYAPPGSAFASGSAQTTSYGGQPITQTCLYTVFGRYNQGVGAWIIESFEKPSFMCQ